LKIILEIISVSTKDNNFLAELQGKQRTTIYSSLNSCLAIKVSKDCSQTYHYASQKEDLAATTSKQYSYR